MSKKHALIIGLKHEGFTVKVLDHLSKVMDGPRLTSWKCSNVRGCVDAVTKIADKTRPVTVLSFDPLLEGNKRNYVFKGHFYTRSRMVPYNDVN